MPAGFTLNLGLLILTGPYYFPETILYFFFFLVHFYSHSPISIFQNGYMNIELPRNPAIPLLGRHSKELKPGTQTEICTSVFRAALFTIGKKCKQPKCPLTGEWINRMWYWCIVECDFALKRSEILQATGWTNLDNIMLSDISQCSQKGSIIWFHLYEVAGIVTFIETK